MKEYSYQAKHMGTNVSLSFVCTDQLTADTIANDSFAVIKDYEQCFSRFLADSELSKLNQKGAGFVSEKFMNVFKRSLQLANLTDNNFNPLVQVKTLGYTHTFQKQKAGEIYNTKDVTAYNTNLNECIIDTKTSHLKLGQNQQLDFGGILKGYLADIIAKNLMKKHRDCLGCIINIGGDLTTIGVDEFHKPFIFYLYNPITGKELPVPIKNKSLATSGTYARQWQTTNGLHHHIVDEQTHQNPKNDIVAVSIVAEDGALTEALTKLFLIQGISKATTIVPPKQYHYQYFTVFKNGETTSTII